ncbi:hypothetical protein GIB67_002100, partial [Kingdonia uniflora]
MILRRLWFMVSTCDRLKQMKEILVSPLKIHRKPNSRKKENLEMGDSKDWLTKKMRVMWKKIEILVMPN